MLLSYFACSRFGRARRIGTTKGSTWPVGGEVQAHKETEWKLSEVSGKTAQPIKTPVRRKNPAIVSKQRPFIAFVAMLKSVVGPEPVTLPSSMAGSENLERKELVMLRGTQTATGGSRVWVVIERERDVVEWVPSLGGNKNGVVMKRVQPGRRVRNGDEKGEEVVELLVD